MMDVNLSRRLWVLADEADRLLERRRDTPRKAGDWDRGTARCNTSPTPRTRRQIIVRRHHLVHLSRLLLQHAEWNDREMVLHLGLPAQQRRHAVRVRDRHGQRIEAKPLIPAPFLRGGHLQRHRLVGDLDRADADLVAVRGSRAAT